MENLILELTALRNYKKSIKICRNKDISYMKSFRRKVLSLSMSSNTKIEKNIYKNALHLICNVMHSGYNPKGCMEIKPHMTILTSK